MTLTDSQKRFLNSELRMECEDQFDRPWELIENPDGEYEYLWSLMIGGRFVDALTPNFAKEVMAR